MTQSKSNFQFISEPFDLTTVNIPNTFYYRITKPIEVWGNYHTQIAFYDSTNQLVYHRQDCFAHAIEINQNSLGFVKWSSNGDALLFYEYKHGHINNGGIYHYLFIDLAEKVVYRIDLYKHEHKFLDDLQTNNFDKAEIIGQLTEMGLQSEKCYTDRIVVSPIKWIIGVERWNPSDRL